MIRNMTMALVLVALLGLPAASAEEGPADDLLCPPPGPAILNYCVEIGERKMDVYSIRDSDEEIPPLCVTTMVCTPAIRLIEIYHFGDAHVISVERAEVDLDFLYLLQWVCDTIEAILGQWFCEVRDPPQHLLLADASGDGFIDGFVIGAEDMNIYVPLL